MEVEGTATGDNPRLTGATDRDVGEATRTGVSVVHWAAVVAHSRDVLRIALQDINLSNILQGHFNRFTR